MSTPRTFSKYADGRRDDELAAEMAKIRLMEQQVAVMDEIVQELREGRRDA